MTIIIMQVLPLVEVEMEPGDALFFHSNVLHRSDQNRSAHRRWAFLIAYNRETNDPVVKHSHPNYTKLHMVSWHVIICSLANAFYLLQVEDSAILDCTSPIDFEGKEFYHP